MAEDREEKFEVRLAVRPIQVFPYLLHLSLTRFILMIFFNIQYKFLVHLYFERMLVLADALFFVPSTYISNVASMSQF